MHQQLSFIPGQLAHADTPVHEEVQRDTDRHVEVPDDLEIPDDSKIPLNLRNNGARWPDCWHIVGCDSDDDRTEADTAYMSCQSSYIDAIALTYNSAGTDYDAIHIDYNWRARLGSVPGWDSVHVANSMYNGMHDCLDDHSFDPYVRSWDAIWQQLHCHIVYQLVGGGSTWDLEGYRTSNWAGYLAPWNGCSQ